MFVDKVKIKFIAGKGGNGVVAWRREKYIAKGGPTGGNGGKGGDIVIRAYSQVPSLESFRNKRIIAAENGIIGGPNGCQGRKGKELSLKVPCGTLLKDAATGEVICDFTEDRQEMTVCSGGRGGCGNRTFKTPTNQAPNYCTEGKEGQVREVELELKLIADVGFVGFPNAGKSTLISALSSYPVKIGAYPFTTLRPNLRYLCFDDYSRVLLADIPGIILGASKNRGLGLEFLRHIERTKVVIYMIDSSGIDGRNPFEDFEVLQNEIGLYNPEILEKPFVVVLNKIDTEESEENVEYFLEMYPFDRKDIMLLSAKEKTGTDAFVSRLSEIFK